MKYHQTSKSYVKTYTLKITGASHSRKSSMADKTPPVGRPRQGGHSRHQPQHRLNAESVEKKLAVLATIEQTSDVRATIEHFYLHLSATAYRSKYAQIYAWK